jgi:methionyl-tRNA formyltransferase
VARVFLITSHYMGVLYIDELLRAGDDITGVAAWPDTAGWYVPVEYDVRSKAFRKYIPLYEPDPKALNSEKFLQVIRKLKPDFIVSGYYPKLFKKDLLSIPPGGCVNIHPTGLPRFRGLSPYFSHMLFGDERNYITMHWLDPGADTGDIIAQTSVEILPEDTGYTCGHRLTEAGAAMFREYWPLVKTGKGPRIKQDESAASVFNFDWAIAEIDWSKNAAQVWNLVRSVTRPMSGAWTTIGGRKMHVFSVRVVGPEDDAALPGKQQMESRRTAPNRPGSVVGVDGEALLVQCGSGRLRILDAEIEGEKAQPLDLLGKLAGKVDIVLGGG